MTPPRSGPSPLIVVLVTALLVFGGYYVWRGFLAFVEDRGDITAQVTREAFSTATAEAVTPFVPPTAFSLSTFTPLPPCQTFVVDVERAVYRACPSTNDDECPIRDVITEGTELCVVGRADGAPEWYEVELNPDGAFRDTVYIHESVVEAANPTATPTVTFTPLPTISPTPSPIVPTLLPDTPRPGEGITAPTLPPAQTVTPAM